MSAPDIGRLREPSHVIYIIIGSLRMDVNTRCERGLYLTSTPGCDPAVLLWADPQLWLVRTEDPMSRPRPPQTTQTNTQSAAPSPV